MGACPKCGKPRVRKNKRGVRHCGHCGDLGRTYSTPDVPVTLAGVAPSIIAPVKRLKVQWRSDAAEQGTNR